MSDYEFEDDEPYVVIEKNSGDLGSFVMGLALGAGIALLFAPKTGVETRRELRRGARRVRDKAEEMVHEVTDTVSEQFGHARERVGDKVGSAKDAVELKKNQVAQAIDAGRAAARQAREELERRIAENKASYQVSRARSASTTEP